jgi:glycolate oxidase FAD binding subunit
MTAIAELSIEDELREQVFMVAANGGEIQIIGGGSKGFYGEAVEALPIDVSAHSGVIDYDPAELVITLRAGCRLVEVEALLAEQGQMFGFEPPCYGEDATIGGMVATGLAGPRRAWAGGIRDFVLGVKILDGRAEFLHFGGRVIKNVAGFDVSRVMVGAMGTLGIILELSIRVVPIFETELTIGFEHGQADEHIRWINELGSRPLPLSASLWQQGVSRIRLSGSELGVADAVQQLGGDSCDDDWAAIKEQGHDFFSGGEAITRVALPPTCADLLDNPGQLIEWSGAQRWLRGDVDMPALRAQLQAQGGNVCAFRNHDSSVAVFHPLTPALLKLQRSLKSSFDPAGIFNRGLLYAEL